MIRVSFYKRNGRIAGFRVSGHSGYAEAGADILCSAVTSAVGLCECIINDAARAGAAVEVLEDRAEITLTLPGTIGQGAYSICLAALEGFEIHMRGLADQYSEYINILEV